MKNGRSMRHLAFPITSTFVYLLLIFALAAESKSNEVWGGGRVVNRGVTTDSITTDIKEDKEQRKDSPGDATNNAYTSRTYDIKSQVAPSDTPTYLDDIVGVYVQYVDYLALLGNTCHNGAAACETFEHFGYIEWKMVAWSTHAGVLPTPGSADSTTPHDIRFFDTFTVVAEQMGCAKAYLARGYLVLSSHPRFSDILGRLNSQYPPQEKGSDKPNSVTLPNGEKINTSDFTAGVADANGNGEEDIGEGPGHESTEEMIENDTPGEDHVGEEPDGYWDSPFSTEPLYNCQTAWLVWDYCGENAPQHGGSAAGQPSM